MSNYDVEIYTRPTCSDCSDLKDFLVRNNVNFKTYDVSSNESYEKQLINLTGNRIVPVIVFKTKKIFSKDKFFIGFDANRQEIIKLLK